MKLRSGKNTTNCLIVKNKIFEVNIDFDFASREWRKNKIYLGQGVFKYLNI